LLFDDVADGVERGCREFFIDLAVSLQPDENSVILINIKNILFIITYVGLKKLFLFYCELFAKASPK
jgi:hypothetical protein